MIAISSEPYAEKEPAKLIELAKKTGLDGIAWSSSHCNPGDIETAKKLAKITNDAGLSIPAYSSNCVAEKGVPVSDLIETAEALGTKAILINAGSKAPSKANEIYYAECAQALRQICSLAKEAGIEIWVISRKDTLTERADSTSLLFRMAECSNLKIIWMPQANLDTKENARQLNILEKDLCGILVYGTQQEQICPIMDDIEAWRTYLNTPANLYIIAQVKDAQSTRLMSDFNVLKVLLEEKQAEAMQENKEN